jgi:hypothetical protein
MGDDLAEAVKMLPHTMDGYGLCITWQRCLRRSAWTSSGKAVVDVSGGDLGLVEMGKTTFDPRLDYNWKRLSCSHSLQLLEYPCTPENVRH